MEKYEKYYMKQIERGEDSENAHDSAHLHHGHGSRVLANIARVASRVYSWWLARSCSDRRVNTSEKNAIEQGSGMTRNDASDEEFAAQ